MRPILEILRTPGLKTATISIPLLAAASGTAAAHGGATGGHGGGMVGGTSGGGMGGLGGFGMLGGGMLL